MTFEFASPYYYLGDRSQPWQMSVSIAGFLFLIFLTVPLVSCKAEEKKQEELLSLPFLAVDLNGNGKIDTIPLEESNVYFDVDGDGLAERTEWISPEDGFLGVIGREERRSLQSMHQRLLSFFTSGLKKIMSFDRNKDGHYDENDYQRYREQSFRDLGFIIARDDNVDGIPETHRNDLISCEFQNIDVASTNYKYEIACVEKSYSVHQFQFSYEDSNVLWVSLCKVLKKSRSQSSRNEYKTLCIDQEYSPNKE